MVKTKLIFIPAPWRSGTHLIQSLKNLPGVKFVFEPWDIGDSISKYYRKKLEIKDVLDTIKKYIDKDKITIIQEKRLGFFIKELIINFPECKIIHYERNKEDWVHSFMNRDIQKEPKGKEESLLHYPFMKDEKNAKDFFNQPKEIWLGKAWEEFQKQSRKIKSKRIIKIKYEDIVLKPEEISKEISNFIGIEFNKNVFGKPHRNSINRSKKNENK